MTTKKMYALFCILMSIVTTKVFAYDFEAKNSDGVTIYYSYMNNKTEVVVCGVGGKFRGYLVIPDEVTRSKKTLKVTRIGTQAFWNCKELTGIAIGNNVKSIGKDAFYECRNLTYVEMPSSVTSIEDSAFGWCSSLTYVEIPDGVTSIGENVFRGCSSLTSIMFPNSVTSIGEDAFYFCYSLTSLRIGNNVESIGAGAFSGCFHLTSVTIPNSVTSIGKYAFGDCSDLTSVISGIENPFMIDDDVFESKNNVIYTNTTLSVPAGTKSAYQSTAGWKNFKNIVEASGSNDTSFTIDGINYDVDGSGTVKVISVNESQTSVSIPSSVSNNGNSYFVSAIGDYAFTQHSNLTSITIPSSVTSIGEYAFYGCSGLTSVNIPNSVTSIGFRAFKGCSGLASVNIPSSLTSIEGGVFADCSGLISVTIPNSVTSIGGSAFSGCSGLTSVNIPNSVTSIGGSAFEKCSNLTSVIIPNSVTDIVADAYSYCSSLISIKVESGNSVYDSRNNCNAIIETKSNKLIAGCKTTIIPNSVTSIGLLAFLGCSGLTSVTIPNNVKNIEGFAFTDCSALSSVTIPNSVTFIGPYAFSLCNGLTSVISEIMNPFYIDSNTFADYVFQYATLYVPIGTIDKYKATEGWDSFTIIKETSPSEINNLENEGLNEIKRYTLDGRVIKNSHKGINIIQMNNGTTQKVLVK